MGLGVQCIQNCHGNQGIMNAAVKVMPPNLLCWPTMSEVGASGTTVEVESSSNILLRFVAV